MKRNYFLLFTLLSALVAKAADYTHYSEWITDSEMKRTPHSYNLNFSSAFPNWSYQTGVELDGILDVYITYGNEKVGDYLKEYPATMIDEKGNIFGYKYNDFNLDNVRPGHFLMRYYQLFPSKKDSLALDLLMSQLENQPRTDEGVWWHKAIYARQVWLDGIFMGLPFYTLAAPFLAPGDETAYYDDAVDQITKTDQRTYDETTRLWKHAWDETHQMFWANAETGLSQHTWARAMGWFTMAMVEILDALPEDYEPRQKVIDLFQRAMKSVVDYQDAQSGVWYDVLDVDDPRNYLEATASSMFAYCLLKGHRMGYLDDSFLAAGIRAYDGIIKEFVKENTNGTISLTKCCEVSGLGPDNKPHRDGSFEYYMSEPVRDNDPKGIGPFIWASLEMERMGYTIGNPIDPTAIRTIRKATVNGDYYDLTGRKTTSPQRGVYIKDGKKHLIK